MFGIYDFRLGGGLGQSGEIAVMTPKMEDYLDKYSVKMRLESGHVPWSQKEADLPQIWLKIR